MMVNRVASILLVLGGGAFFFAMMHWMFSAGKATSYIAGNGYLALFLTLTLGVILSAIFIFTGFAIWTIKKRVTVK